MSKPFEKLPIFEDFDHAASFGEMADILIRAPIAVLRRYDMTLRNTLHNRHFHEGVAYLEMANVAMDGVRDPMGRVTEDANELLEKASASLRAAAAERDAARKGRV